MSSQLCLELKAERTRLSNQCAVILGRLQKGRVSNRELSGIALKYSGRVSELRQKGHDIRVVFNDRASGLTQYALFVGGQEWDQW